VTKNKIQLIDILCHQLAKADDHVNTKLYKLVVTGPTPSPFLIDKGVKRDRYDLWMLHEEADIIIVQQVIYAATKGARSVNVLCDDTDVLVGLLLMYHYKVQHLECQLTMQSTNGNRTVIDVVESVKSTKTLSTFYQLCMPSLGVTPLQPRLEWEKVVL
jgi:hypothetical protein